MSDYVSRFVSTPDGLKLHVRVYGPPTARSLPVVCLHGLARTSADFHRLALALSGHPANHRQVIAIDYRGRGRSDFDPNPANYNVGTELNDVLTVLSALDVRPAVFIGTSRGGILTMLLATVRPQAIVGAVLNDIGPVIEPVGLMRIKGYVGKLSQPEKFRARRRDAAPTARRTIPQPHGRRLDGFCPAHLRGARRQARALLRSSAGADPGRFRHRTSRCRRCGSNSRRWRVSR